MISNCKGCECEFNEVIKYLKLGLHFAGCGLGEKEHLLMIMVNDIGEVVIE